MNRVNNRQILASAMSAVLLSLTASAIAEDEPVFAHKFTATARDVRTLHGNVDAVLPDGRILLGGNVGLATTGKFEEGAAWLACVDPQGHVLWSARAPEERNAASLFPLSSDGNSIWIAGFRKDGMFSIAKFDGRTLAKSGAVQLTSAATKDSAPYLQFHSEQPDDFDLQVSFVQTAGATIRVAVFGGDLRLRFDKLYAFDFAKDPKKAGALAAPYLIRLPDKSGYYFCLRKQVPPAVNGSGGAAVIKLGNSGEVLWAKTYALDSAPDTEFEPHQTSDGSILLHVAKNAGTVMLRMNPDGTIQWSTFVPRMAVNFPDFGFGWEPYRFVQPYLFADGMQITSAKLYCSVFAINYETGAIEKQLKLASPGGIGFTEIADGSIYVTLLDQAMMGPKGSRAALLAFDTNLKFLGARKVRNAEPHWPILRRSAPGKLLCSYSYADQKAVVVETVGSNSPCSILENLSTSFSKCDFHSQPVSIASATLPGITIADIKSELRDTDISLVPFEMVSSACGKQ